MENLTANRINEVLVFKTNLLSKKISEIIISDMKIINPQALCSFDLEDCDKIFRVENSIINAEDIQKYFKLIGFQCIELK